MGRQAHRAALPIEGYEGAQASTRQGPAGPCRNRPDPAQGSPALLTAAALAAPLPHSLSALIALLVVLGNGSKTSTETGAAAPHASRLSGGSTARPTAPDMGGSSPGAHGPPQQASWSVTLSGRAAKIWLSSAIWRRRGWPLRAQLL